MHLCACYKRKSNMWLDVRVVGFDKLCGRKMKLIFLKRYYIKKVLWSRPCPLVTRMVLGASTSMAVISAGTCAG